MARVAERKRSAQISRVMARLTSGDDDGAIKLIARGRQDGADVASASAVRVPVQHVAPSHDGRDDFVGDDGPGGFCDDGPDDGAPDPHDSSESSCEDTAWDSETDDGEDDTSKEGYAQLNDHTTHLLTVLPRAGKMPTALRSAVAQAPTASPKLPASLGGKRRRRSLPTPLRRR